MKLVPRLASRRLDKLLREFPAVLLLGPRQCGKSTLAREGRPDWVHLDLERPADEALLRGDLEGFLDSHPGKLAIDEAQRMPALFPALRHFIDKGKGRGRYLLTGSASPALIKTVSESLAGRVGILELTPFRFDELAGTPRHSDRMFWGGFPPVHARRGAHARASWLDAYVSTFLERDLPTFGVRLPASRLRTLWTMLTHVHGNLLSLSDLARSLGVSVPTVAGDLDVLEHTFMIRRLQPFHANVQKRLTKSPKLYIRDSGLLHFLAGLRAPGELAAWPRRGASFEGAVIEELVARAADGSVRPEVYFWRTGAGSEVDLLLVTGRSVVPIEIKFGASIDPRSLAGLRACMSDLGLKHGYVVYTGDERRHAGAGIDLVPWKKASSGEATFA